MCEYHFELLSILQRKDVTGKMRRLIDRTNATTNNNPKHIIEHRGSAKFKRLKNTYPYSNNTIKFKSKIKINY